MWSRILFGSALSAQLLVFLASGGAILADEPTSEVSTPLFLREKTLRIEVIQGRVQIISVRGAQNRTMQKGSPDADVRETLSLQAGPDELMVRFESVLPERRLLLGQAEHKSFLLEREGFQVGKTTHFHFEQREDGRCEVSFDGLEKPLVCAGGLWHLAILHPQVFHEQVVPVLEELSPDWGLAAQAMEVRKQLVRTAKTNNAVKTEEWSQWTNDLASDNFATRQAADRGLRTAGPQVLGFLGQMQKMDLQSEQKARLKRIAKQLVPPLPDSPELVVAWLEHDPQIWLALLAGSPDEEQLAAKQRLELIGGEPVRFDASAPADVRQAQLRRLERRFSEK